MSMGQRAGVQGGGVQGAGAGGRGQGCWAGDTGQSFTKHSVQTVCLLHRQQEIGQILRYFYGPIECVPDILTRAPSP